MIKRTDREEFEIIKEFFKSFRFHEVICHDSIIKTLGRIDFMREYVITGKKNKSIEEPFYCLIDNLKTKHNLSKVELLGVLNWYIIDKCILSSKIEEDDIDDLQEEEK